MSKAVAVLAAPFTGGASLAALAPKSPVSAIAPQNLAPVQAVAKAAGLGGLLPGQGTGAVNIPSAPAAPSVDVAAAKAEEEKTKQLRERARRSSILYGQAGEFEKAPSFAPSLLGLGSRQTLG